MSVFLVQLSVGGSKPFQTASKNVLVQWRLSGIGLQIRRKVNLYGKSSITTLCIKF